MASFDKKIFIFCSSINTIENIEDEDKYRNTYAYINEGKSLGKIE